MKLFYTPVERLLLTIHDPATVALNSFLWKSAWDIWWALDDKRLRLSGKEARLANHVAGLLPV